MKYLLLSQHISLRLDLGLRNHDTGMALIPRRFIDLPMDDSSDNDTKRPTPG